MESRFCTYKRVGYLRQKIANELGIEFTGVIYASPGVLKHIIKRHGRQLNKKTRDSILEWMKKILEEPDYIGIYKNEGGQTAVEFIKRVYTNLLLGVEVDEKNEYIYVTTMYPITDKKIENKIYSGKLIDIKRIK
ncbi:PBECR2 nuclease fold domain-containing protein [Clostridium sp. D53t1_180928_C8]|uniref:PBECR3 domain-containing polyvalent protein n=1 Tax=Clostridium sp. D53t1_180928_C8 TaxID=2787101 RepID=UPI0018A9076D|nr:PBECR2 nuclease fold domain-containing protein [Clostridium sp. D53t1_180928_C8]